jgi:hypothetical protein
MDGLDHQLYVNLHDQIRKIEGLARDPWLRPEMRRALRVLASDLDASWAKFERCQRRINPPGCPNDGGPTAADIAGEVQHDIG